jgi:mono/diheme cytochrome c family protein
MLKNLFFIALAALIAVGVVQAKQSTSNTLVVPVSKVAANDGKQMYVNYCAPCHGMDGKGNGPVAPVLKRQPANLALLSKAHGGKFPASHIITVLQFGTENPSHGSALMPVWGPMFEKMDSHTLPQDDARALRISNLSEYLRSMQEK